MTELHIPAPHQSLHQGAKTLSRLARAGLIGITVLATLFPIFWTFLLSLKDLAQAFHWPPLFIFRPTLENYAHSLLGTGLSLPITPYLKNSLIVALSSTVTSVLVGTLGGYAFARYRFKGKETLMFSVLTTLMLPPVLIALPTYVLMLTLRLTGHLVAIVLAHALFNIPFVVWLMRGFFQDVPFEIEEAAMIDGCGPLQLFAYVALPLASPGLVSTAILSAFYSWNEFIFAMILSGAQSMTAPVYIATFQRQVEMIQWGELGAAVVLTILPLVVFTLLIQRYLVRGLTLGAVKG